MRPPVITTTMMGDGIASGYILRTGDAMTGDLNMGLNRLLMHDGVTGAIMKGSAASERMHFRNIADADYADASFQSMNLTDNLIMVPDKLVDGVDVSNLHKIEVDDYAEVHITGDLANHIAKTYVIPGGLLGANGSLVCMASGYCFGNNANKNIGFHFAANVVGAIVVPASVNAVGWKIFHYLWNLGALNSQKLGHVGIIDGVVPVSNSNYLTAEDTSGDVNLTLNVSLLNAADDIYVEDWQVFVKPS